MRLLYLTCRSLFRYLGRRSGLIVGHVYVAVALPKTHEGTEFANGLILVRIYRFEARFDQEGSRDSADISEPKVARFLVNPRHSI
jgi:hypothetical protein